MYGRVIFMIHNSANLRYYWELDIRESNRICKECVKKHSKKNIKWKRLNMIVMK